MKNICRIFLCFFAFSFFICACSDGNAIFSSSKKYKVLFEKNPNVTKEQVLSKGFAIGKVTAQDVNAENLVVITISIDKEKVPLMKTTTVFYVSEGALHYETMGEEGGSPLPENGKILGFPSKASLVMFQTRIKMRDFAGTVKEKAGEWYDLAVQKSNEWYRKATE